MLPTFNRKTKINNFKFLCGKIIYFEIIYIYMCVCVCVRVCVRVAETYENEYNTLLQI